MTSVGERRRSTVNQLMYSCNSKSSGDLQEVVEACMISKRLKLSVAEDGGGGGGGSDGQHNKLMSHIMMERNRRKQMNEHLSVLISLMPCFYVKRGDQASIIGSVVNYISELHLVIQSLEAKKRRKVSGELAMSQRPLISPRPIVPISPRTPQPRSPYRANIIVPPFIAPSLDTSPFTNSDSTIELVANSRSAVAEVEVKFGGGGGNLLLKTRSHQIPGQTTKVIAALENLSLEVLHADISVVDEIMVNSFTIKIGVECQLSAEELAHHVQQAFC